MNDELKIKQFKAIRRTIWKTKIKDALESLGESFAMIVIFALFCLGMGWLLAEIF